MSHKPVRVKNLDKSTKRGVVYQDYEEDKRGRRVKSKLSHKPKTTTANPSSAPIPAAWIDASDHEEPEPVAAEGDFAGVELDWDDCVPGEKEESDAKRKASTSHYTPNMALKDWLIHHFNTYIVSLFQRQSSPSVPQCTKCQGTAPKLKLYSCEDCFGLSPVCKDCLLSSHSMLPTHRVNIWNGAWWERTSLSDLGLVLYLGHCGEQCEQQTGHDSIWVGDLSGFQSVNVHYCTHEGHPSRSAQLLAIGLFPCSDDTPESAFTLSLLDHYDICSTLGAMTAQKYYQVLVKRTNAAFPHQVPDRYRELQATHRRYVHTKNHMRSGRAYEAHSLEKNLDHAVQCVGCPAPGFNFNPKLVPAIIIAFFRFWMSYDGNFQNKRKLKKVDVDDVCLSDGLQYFVQHAAYELWAKIGGKERQKGVRPECDNHKAGRSDTYGIWGGLDVTGMGLFSCTRHTVVLPQGITDFYGGEKFRFGDYGFGSVVNYKLRQGECTFGMTYDIWCQWIINLKKRAEQFPINVSIPSQLDLIGGIPKWHLVGHQKACAIRYSLNHMQYCGRMDGEGPERFWSYLNETSGSTSEKSPGYRRDSINNIVDSWNFAKVVGIHKHLRSGFQEAKEMYGKQHKAFEELNSSLPQEVTLAWSKAPVEAMLGANGKWQSPLYPIEVHAETFQQVLRQERSRERADAHTPARRIGASQWIATGIELEHSMHLVRKQGDEMPEDATDAMFNSLDAAKTSLLKKIQAFQQSMPSYMGDNTVRPDHPDRRKVLNAEPEHTELGLPSSHLPESLNTAGLTSMLEMERTLRRAICDDAIQSLRSLLGAKAATLKFKKRNLRGRIATDKAESNLQEHGKKIAAVQWVYNNSRAAMVRLGMGESDLERYQQVTVKDLKYLKSYLDEESGQLGEGYREVPWLWRTCEFGNKEEWQVQVLKTEWFRSRERYRRWEEELMLIKRDVLLAHNSFRSFETIWHFKASCPQNLSGMSEYAAKKSHLYRLLREQIHKTCLEVIEDPVVDLGWKEGWE